MEKPMIKWKDMSFAQKVRFWIITAVILVIIIMGSVVTYRMFIGDTVKASASAFGVEGSIGVGQVRNTK